MAIPGEDDNVGLVCRTTSTPLELAVRIAGGVGSWLVQWEIRLEREVKVKTYKVHHAKKLVLYSGSNGEPLKVLENECDIIGVLPCVHGEN